MASATQHPRRQRTINCLDTDRLGYILVQLGVCVMRAEAHSALILLTCFYISSHTVLHLSAVHVPLKQQYELYGVVGICLAECLVGCQVARSFSCPLTGTSHKRHICVLSNYAHKCALKAYKQSSSA